MTTTVRAPIFGAAIAAALTITLDTVTAAEPVRVMRLDGVEVTAHRGNFDENGNLDVVRLDGVVVTAHRAAN